MFKHQILIAALIAGASGSVYAYDIGHLTCQNVGQLAAQMVMARKSGVPAEAYLKALDEKLPADANVERNLAMNIARLVYTNDQVASMAPEEAFAAFAQHCVQGQEQDSTSGQQEQTPDADQNENDTDGDEHSQ
jgi:hypothetical protein